MNNDYISAAVFTGMAVIYGLELRRRKSAGNLNQQGLCARCATKLQPQSAVTIQQYRILQPQFYYCDTCLVVLRKRERIFMATCVIAVALTFIIGGYQLTRA